MMDPSRFGESPIKPQNSEVWKAICNGLGMYFIQRRRRTLNF